MQPPDDLYAPNSPYHQQRRWTHPHSLRCLQAAVTLLGTPESLLDVGCAEGVHIAWAVEHGIDAIGIDLAVPESHERLMRADLCHPVDVRRQFEWVICWEVAEHLPSSAAETLVDTLVRHMAPKGRIVFTAAGPGQRGPGHINCKSPIYWQRLFSERGMGYAEALSSELRRRWLQCSPKTAWYGRNVSVFWRVA